MHKINPAKSLSAPTASVQVGTGHVMCCLTLADELRGRGVDVIFICCEFAGNLCGYIEEKGYVVHCLPVETDLDILGTGFHEN
jgi:UDP-2,4-diacetamido-2,4,6-trideoxy-beta-L-altropyranose hydrolase